MRGNIEVAKRGFSFFPPHEVRKIPKTNRGKRSFRNRIGGVIYTPLLLGENLLEMNKRERVTTTLRLPRKKLQLLKVVANLQNKKVNEILNELIDEYLEKHKSLISNLSEGKEKKTLKEKWKTLKKQTIKVRDWREVEGEFYDEMSTGY